MPQQREPMPWEDPLTPATTGYKVEGLEGTEPKIELKPIQKPAQSMRQPMPWEDPITTTTTTQPPSGPNPFQKAGSAYVEGLGLPLLYDIIGGASRDPKRIERSKQAMHAVLQGIANEPSRVWGELSNVGQSMLNLDLPGIAYHTAGAVPMLGPATQQIAQDIGRGDPAAAVGHTGALLTPFVAKPLGRAAATGATFAKGAVPAAVKAAVTKPPYGAALVGELLGGHKGAVIAGAAAKTPGVIIEGIQGGRAALSARAAAIAEQLSAENAAAAAARQAGDEGLAEQIRTGRAAEAEAAREARRTARESAMAAAEEADARAAAARQGQLPVTQPTPEERAIITPEEKAVPTAELQVSAEDLTGQPAATARTASEIGKDLDQAWQTYHDLADRHEANPTPETAAAAEQARERVHELFTEYHGRGPTTEPPVTEAPPTEPIRKPPVAATEPAPAPASREALAQQLESALRPDLIHDFLVRNKIPTSMLDEFGDKEWRMVSQGAGLTNPPTPEEIPGIRARLAEYEGAATLPAETGKMTPAEATQQFEKQRQVRARGRKKAPVTETPAEAPAQAQPAVEPTLADLMQGKSPEEIAQALKVMTEESGTAAGAQPAAEGPRAPTQSQKRVEALAQHLAGISDLSTEAIATLPDNPNALRQLERLSEGIDIEGRPTADEIPQIVDRVREIRSGTAPATTEVPGVSISDILSRPDDVANAAMERMRKRGSFGTKFKTGVDPADVADLSIWGASKLIKGAQKIVGGITDFATWANAMARDFGEAIIPHLDNLWQKSKAIADRATKDVKRRSMEDLDVRIPDEVRVVSKDPTKTVEGKPFHSLDLNQPSEGFLPMRKAGADQANNLIQRIWQEAQQESEAGGGTTAADAVRETGARPPDAEFWDKSFSLPQRARYWYELSGESFTGKHMDIPREYQPAFIDAVAGTSGGVEPGPNLQRALGIFSEDLQKQPVMTDLRDPASARNALNPAAQDLQSLKYGSFSGTMQHTSGLSAKPPLTTNDVQVASMFGIDGADIGKNPVLYEVLSRFFLKLRDAQNAELAAGAQPWETYQMQAPSWVYERIRKNPAKAAEYDDYSQVFPSIIQKLADAGVPTPGGKITMETLMDPRTPNLMSGTRQQFMSTPVATVEVATNRTVRGARAADLLSQLDQLDPEVPWVRNAKAEYEQIQRNTMRDLAMRQAGQPSVISQLMSEIFGRKVDVSRLDWNGYGTFEGTINPNLRIPLTGRTSSGEWATLSEGQRKAFLSILGQDLQQEAMAASHFKNVPHGQGDTFSVFLNRYDGKVDGPAIRAFSDKIGYPVNVTQYPNGVTIDVNIGGFDTKPAAEAILNAADETFGQDPAIKNLKVVANQYASDYVHRSEYGKNINAQRKASSTTKSKAGESGGVGEGRPAIGEPSNLDRIREAIQEISRQRDAEFADWTKSNRKRLEKHVTRPPKGKPQASLRDLMQTPEAAA